MKYARIVPPEINNASPHNDRFMALSADSLSIPLTMHVLRDDGYKYLVIAARISASDQRRTRARDKGRRFSVTSWSRGTTPIASASHPTVRGARSEGFRAASDDQLLAIADSRPAPAAADNMECGCRGGARDAHRCWP